MSCQDCAALTERIEIGEKRLAESEKLVDGLRQELSLAMQLIQQMRRRMFGASSDKINPDQQTFDSLLQECDIINGESVPAQAETQKKSPASGRSPPTLPISMAG